MNRWINTSRDDDDDDEKTKVLYVKMKDKARAIRKGLTRLDLSGKGLKNRLSKQSVFHYIIV